SAGALWGAPGSAVFNTAGQRRWRVVRKSRTVPTEGAASTARDSSRHAQIAGSRSSVRPARHIDHFAAGHVVHPRIHLTHAIEGLLQIGGRFADFRFDLDTDLVTEFGNSLAD